MSDNITHNFVAQY